MLVECGVIDSKKKIGIEYYKAASGLRIAHRMQVPNLAPGQKMKANMANLRKSINLHGSKCVAVVLGRKCLGKREEYLPYWQKFSPFIRRPHEIQTVAKAFFRDVFHGESYAGIHWRYDTYDWNDMCKESRPDAAKERNHILCQFSEKLEKGDKQVLEMMSTNLHKKLQDCFTTLS